MNTAQWCHQFEAPLLHSDLVIRDYLNRDLALYLPMLPVSRNLDLAFDKLSFAARPGIRCVLLGMPATQNTHPVSWLGRNMNRRPTVTVSKSRIANFPSAAVITAQSSMSTSWSKMRISLKARKKSTSPVCSSETAGTIL